MGCRLFLTTLLFFPLLVMGQVPHKRALPPELQEVSGLVAQGDSIFWWINDSGNSPVIFGTDRNGKLVDSLFPPVHNRDWEALAVNQEGHLIVGDIGNNCNCRQDLTLYTVQIDGSLVDSFRFHLSDQTQFPPAEKQHWNFNLEAMLWYQDTIHLFSKNHIGAGNFHSKHYRLPLDHSTQTAQLVDSILLRKRVVTGASISTSGKVALIAYHYKKWLGWLPTSKANVFLLEGFPGSLFFAGQLKRYWIWPFWIATQFEAIDFITDNVVLLGSEQTSFVRPRAQRKRLRKKQTKD
jgi:hypothetical protein